MANLPPALSSGSLDQERISREAVEAERRERLLAAVTEVFAKRGYQAAAVDHLLAGGKISMGGFYEYFEGKEDCFVQAYDRVVRLVDERVRSAVPAEAGWAEQVARGVRALVEFVIAEPLAARIVLLEAQTGGAEALRRYSETRQQAAAFLRRGRAEGRQGKKLPESFEDATASGIVWLLQSRLSRGELGRAEDLYPQIAEVVLEPYLGSERTRRVLASVAEEPAGPR